MFALTISQPYASLIADGEKWIENRRWETKYRGPLAIHAGKGTQYLDSAELARHYSSGVLAVCQLSACFRLADLDRLGEQLATVGLTVEAVRQHEYTEGPWCWLLQNVRRLRASCPCRGAQGLWLWTPSGELDSLF